MEKKVPNFTIWHTFLNDIFPPWEWKKRIKRSVDDNYFLNRKRNHGCTNVCLMHLLLSILYFKMNYYEEQRKPITIYFVQINFIDERLSTHLDFGSFQFLFVYRCKLPVTHLLISPLLLKMLCFKIENKQQKLCAVMLVSYF